jgi:hypothetical protein
MRVIRLLVIVGLIGAVLAWALWRWTRREPGLEAPGAADSTRAGVRAVQLYFATPDGDGLVSESREILEATGIHDRVAALVRELDRGPRGRGVAALPAGTSALHVYLDDHGLLTLDLSGAFRRGFHGGASAEYAAVASLIRTLGANLPEVKRVLIVCAGRPISTLGGHLPLDRPMEVSDWP